MTAINPVAAIALAAVAAALYIAALATNSYPVNVAFWAVVWVAIFYAFAGIGIQLWKLRQIWKLRR